MRRALLLLLTISAFVASLFVLPVHAPTKKGDAAFGAARLASVILASKPPPRKAERTPLPAMTPRVFAIAPARLVLANAPAPPSTWTPPAPDRAELMVFLN